MRFSGRDWAESLFRRSKEEVEEAVSELTMEWGLELVFNFGFESEFMDKFKIESSVELTFEIVSEIEDGWELEVIRGELLRAATLSFLEDSDFSFAFFSITARDYGEERVKYDSYLGLRSA